jgi:phosphatidylglycerophosphate synthase
MSGTTIRRPIKARDSRWAAATALRLARAGLQPNQISVLSVVFALLTAICLIMARDGGAGARIALLVAGAACIPLRLLCNLFDGMVAVECGLGTKSGAIYNELPDRVSDVLVTVGAGYSIAWIGWGPELGWAAGVLAMMTAYVRTLGASAGASQDFRGPMAKQQRMVVMVAACLLTAGEIALGWAERAMTIGLWLIVVGCVVTCVRRARRILRELESQ